MPMPDHGTSGYYWSSMSDSNIYDGRYLKFGYSYVYTDMVLSEISRSSGFSLRCLAS